MRKILITLICIIILTACSVTDDIVQVEDNSYEQQIEKIKSDYETQLNSMKEEVELLRKSLDKVTKKYNDLISEDIPVVIADTDDLISVDDYDFRIFIAGSNVLEDGVTLVLESYDSNNDVDWLKIWEGIPVTELALNSDITVSTDRLYIVVNGDLNILHVETGALVEVVEDVGSSDTAPVIDEMGVIYTIGQYEPYVTAINSDGHILWQIRDELLTVAYDIEIDVDLLKVKTISGTFIVGRDGEIQSGPNNDD